MNNIHRLQTWKSRLQTDHKGAVKKNMTNLMIHLECLESLGSTIRFNELTQNIEWENRPFDETTDVIAVQMILDDANFEPPKSNLYSAIIAHAKKNSYHPVREYLDELRWDKIPRIDTWLVDYMGAEDTPFNRLAARKTLIGAVARAYDPGCKLDTMLILEGEQGAKKSSAIEALFSPRFYTASVSLFKDHQKMVMQTFGAWAIELPEFAAVMRKDMNFVKGLMTIQTDKVPLPYARSISEHPRQFITIATYNPEEDEGYLEDPTGNRRFWPVRVKMADIDKIKKYRNQLWAEAKHAYHENNEVWWFDGAEEEAIANQNVSHRASSEVWAEILGDKIHPEDHVIHSSTVYTLLGLAADRLTKDVRNRVGRAMKELGYKNEPRYMNGKSTRVWVKPGGD